MEGKRDEKRERTFERREERAAGGVERRTDLLPT